MGVSRKARCSPSDERARSECFRWSAASLMSLKCDYNCSVLAIWGACRWRRLVSASAISSRWRNRKRIAILTVHSPLKKKSSSPPPIKKQSMLLHQQIQSGPSDCQYISSLQELTGWAAGELWNADSTSLWKGRPVDLSPRCHQDDVSLWIWNP